MHVSKFDTYEHSVYISVRSANLYDSEVLRKPCITWNLYLDGLEFVATIVLTENQILSGFAPSLIYVDAIYKYIYNRVYLSEWMILCEGLAIPFWYPTNVIRRSPAAPCLARIFLMECGRKNRSSMFCDKRSETLAMVLRTITRDRAKKSHRILDAPYQNIWINSRRHLICAEPFVEFGRFCN